MNEFITFLEASHRLNREAQNVQSNAPRRNAMFLPGSSLYKLLTSAPGARPGVRPGFRSTQIQRACRFACTLYLNAIILEFESRPDKLEEYFKRLSSRVIEQELDWSKDP